MTKLLTSALAALALTAGAASAENTFRIEPTLSTTSSVALSNVQADRAGTIQVYADDDELVGFGRNLGSARINAGVTGDVAIALSEPFDGDVVVVMMNPDHWVAQATTRSFLTSADLNSSAFVSGTSEFQLARGLVSAEAVCVVTSSDGQLVHDRRGNVVTC